MDTPSFDLQPDPRILQMLGEINLAQWKCLAELIDNSVDGFLSASRDEGDLSAPEVLVQIPTNDSPQSRVEVSDNGPGMTVETLEYAVRAGWSGNDAIGSLGMFGMGFNIATARLGAVTTVWTSRAGDAERTGLRIDFEELRRQRHFRIPRLTQPKHDPSAHGTTVTIERLKPEQRQFFAKNANRSRLMKDLRRAYSAMLRKGGRPLEFRLKVNTTLVEGKRHCVWSAERFVQSPRYGQIQAVQEINVKLPPRSFCKRCWQWLTSGESTCPSCGVGDHVVGRDRVVRGWLGIQRYLSETDYGIDFIRHGRTIESANKDLFSWQADEDDAPELEYPIDDPRGRGRIVGEIHLDHCRVMYTKDRFDRTDQAWLDMVRIVRGEGPLRPEKAERLGFGGNESTLYRLFQGYRRSNPKERKVAGAWTRILVVPQNDQAIE